MKPKRRPWYRRLTFLGWITFGGIPLVVICIVMALVVELRDGSANKSCLSKGYMGAKRADWSWDYYCYKRENNTDVVIPLEDLP